MGETMPKHTLPTATEGNEPDTVDNTAVKAVFDLWVGLYRNTRRPPVLDARRRTRIRKALADYGHDTVEAAVRGAAAWLEAVKVHDKSFEMTDQGRKLIDKPGAGPIWSRNYDLVTGRPIFGDKDQTIHDDVNEISIGRRNGYSWWISSPQRALDLYADWAARNGHQPG